MREPIEAARQFYILYHQQKKCVIDNTWLKVWHEKTEETIGSLTENSAKVARSIANWSEMQVKGSNIFLIAKFKED